MQGLFDLLMQKGLYKAWLVALVLILGGCTLFELRHEDTLLAKAYNSRLYLEDIREHIPQNASPEDSIAIIQRYVDRWVSQQVFVHHAKQTLPDHKMNFDARIADYRNALIIHAYESELARTEMDTVVTAEEIGQYYEQNISHLLLRDNIVRANYIKLPLNVPNQNVVRSLYRSDNSDDLERLENYCLENAAVYYLGKDAWMVFRELLIDMPLNINNQATYLQNNRFAEITDDYYRYFLYIYEYRLRGDVSPLDFERDNIRMLILNHRKKQFIESKRREFFNQAIEASKIETYF